MDELEVVGFQVKFHFLILWCNWLCSQISPHPSNYSGVDFYERTFCNCYNYFERRDKVDCMDLLKVGPEFAIKWTTNQAAEPSKLFDEPTFIC